MTNDWVTVTEDSYVEQDLMVEDYQLTREAARLIRSEVLLKNCQRRWTQLVSAAQTDAYLALLVAQLKPPPTLPPDPATVEGQRQISLNDD